MKRLNLLVLLVLLACLIAPLAVHAQDAAPESPSVLTEKWFTDLESFLGTYGGLVGVAVTFIVQVLKPLPLFSNVSARFLNAGVSSVLVVGLLLATNFGYGTQYQAGIDALPVIGKAVLSVLVAFGFSTGYHEAAAALGVPGGYKRTPYWQTE
jgi:hypothetical protein